MHSDKKCLYRLVEASILALGLAILPAPTFSADSASIKDLPTDLRTAINRAIGSDQAAYHFRESGAGCFEARYAALGADVLVGTKGLTVRAGAGAWTLGASAPSVSGNAPAAGLPRQTAPNRVEVDRGWASEWVVNGPSGLEQGWDIPKRPSWAEENELLIPLEQDGNLRAVTAEADGRAICVRDAQGREILRYAGLHVIDSAGRELPARFETRISDGALEIKVTDAGAVYPITIDPWVESAKLIATDRQAGDHLGYSVALSANGRICAAGASRSSPGGISQAGAVYIFTNTAGNWAGVSNQAAKLFASDRQASDYLGWSVALSADGGICAAGSYASSPGGAGAVYIFTNGAGTWSGVSNESAKLVASDKVQGDHLGNSVALSTNGEICAAGAFCAGQAGAVYIFKNAAGSWAGVSNQVTKLVSSDIQIADNLGYSVALSANGGICAAGAICSSPGGTNQAGAVYIFTNTAGSWAGVSNENAKLFASDRLAGDYLGNSVALNADGGICAAGAPNSSPGGTNYVGAGAVYIFTNAAGSWSGVSNQASKLIASDRQALDALGLSVALSADGGICAAGAYFSSPGGTNKAGAVYIFTNAAGSWAGVSNQADKLFASDRQAFDYLGWSVALNADGGICAAGAPDSSPGGTSQAGHVVSWNKPNQTITFPAISDQDVTNRLTLSATASSGLAVSFAVGSGPATISGNVATFSATGRVSIIASQAGDANWAPAPNVTNAFNVVPTGIGWLGIGILPAEVVAAGAHWRVDGGDWQTSWTILTGLTAGAHTVSYSVVTNYDAPVDQAVTIAPNQLAIVQGIYTNHMLYTAYDFLAADFDGDHKADMSLLIKVPIGGGIGPYLWAIACSSRNYEWYAAALYGYPDANGIAADFDGDRKPDFGSYSRINGVWRAMLSGSQNTEYIMPIFLGNEYGTPVTGDFDGDRQADPAVYYPPTGDWQVRFSSIHETLMFANLLGGTGFAAAAGDVDGDGIDDPFVCNMETGQCLSIWSRFGNMRVTSETGFLGSPGWLLVMADYDGDGLADPAVVNPLDGTLIVRYAASGFQIPVTYPEAFYPHN